MEVKLHGEVVGIHDDQGIRAHATRHAIMVVDALPNKQVKSALRRMVSDLYFINVKFGALESYYTTHQAESMPVAEFQQLTEALRIVLGMKTSTEVEGQRIIADAETAATAVDGH